MKRLELLEWAMYKIVILCMIAFFIISIYNIVMFRVYNNDDDHLKIIVNIAIESVMIFVGIFFLKVWYQGKMNTMQLRFCGHCCLFLICTGITAIIDSSHRL